MKLLVKKVKHYKLLKLKYGDPRTPFDYEYDPLDYDIIVVDEMSMIDGYLLSNY